ncbi:phage protein [Streptococcus pneumoniae]|nr:phage protein [Streptococcus pneumoniae]
MSLSENDKRVLRLIKVGAENSITGSEISLTTKLTERTVRDIIKRLAVLMNSDLESYKETLKEVGGYV